MKIGDVKQAVIKAAVKRGGKPTISCRRLLQLAEKSGVAPKRIGRLCDEEKIKIRQCQLGCF